MFFEIVQIIKGNIQTHFSTHRGLRLFRIITQSIAWYRESGQFNNIKQNKTERSNHPEAPLPGQDTNSTPVSCLIIQLFYTCIHSLMLFQWVFVIS